MRLERALKDMRSYMQRAARVCQFYRAEPVVTCSARKPVAPTSRRDRNLVVSDVTDVHGRCTGRPKAENAEIRMRVQPRRKSKILPCRISLARATSFRSKILSINFDHHFLIFPDISKHGRRDNPRNPRCARNDVTCRYRLFVKPF